jgi:hypothetical protein
MKKGGRLKGIDLILSRLRFADKSSMTDRNAQVIIRAVLRQAALPSILATRTSYYTRFATGVGKHRMRFRDRRTGTAMVRYERNKGTKVHLQSDQTHDLKQPGEQPPARRLNPQTQHQKESPSSRAASPPPSRQTPHKTITTLQVCSSSSFAQSFTNPRYEASLTSNDCLLQGKAQSRISQRLRQSTTQTTTKFRSEGVVQQTVSQSTIVKP